MKSLSIKLGVVVLVIGFPILCYGGNVITRIGDYYIGQDIKTVRGLVEFTHEKYAVFQSFPGWFGLPGEKIFEAPDVTFNRHRWYLTVGSMNGKIYQLGLQYINNDRALADSVFEETLRYIKSQMGTPTEQTKTPKRYIWDYVDGNVLLGVQEAIGFWSINFIVTGKEGKGAFKYVEVSGANWKLYMANDFGDWFYDAETITRPSKDTVRVWGKTVYTDKGVMRRVTDMRVISEKYRAIYEKYKDLESKYKDLSYEQNLIEINCANRKSRTLKGTSYSRDGSVLWNFTPEAPDWNEVVPGSVVVPLYEIICKQKE